MRTRKTTRWVGVFVMAIGGAGCCGEPCNETHGGTLPVYSGPYFGQPAPGRAPEVFAPGVVSTGMNELNSVFSPDGTEFYFTIEGPRRWVIMVSYLREGVWTRPEAAAFQGRYGGVDMAFSPDGNRLYYCSLRPLSGTGDPSETADIWYVERTDDGWSEPINPVPPINSEHH